MTQSSVSYRDIFIRAINDTINFFGWNTQTILFAILMFFIGACMHYKLFGKKLALDELKVILSFVLIPFFLLFFINLYKAPYEILKEKDIEYLNEINGFNIKIAGLNKELSVVKMRTAGIRIAHQKQFDSPYQEFPHGLEVIIQTNRIIEPVYFQLNFSGEIDVSKSDIYLTQTHTYQAKYKGHKRGTSNTIVFKWDSPAFTPDKVIKVTVFSKSNVKVTNFILLSH